jgi:methylenetetrahydrofolate dehydrogenase (NADP+)/methenyltetrahydrofolate cyclohydrolase
MILLDGKKVAEQMKQEIRQQVETMKQQDGKVPHLGVILVGNDGGSQTYVKHKLRDCEEVGFKATPKYLKEDIPEKDLLYFIESMNADDDLDGFIVQLPLPKHIDEQRVIEAISPRKDVDGFHPENVGRMMIGLPGFVPATPAGIVELLRRYEIDTRGQHCVVLGRSNIVGKPASMLMAQKEVGNATVTICHSHTKDLPAMTRRADILIAAMGQSEFVTADMVKDGAVVIDVGTTRVTDATAAQGWRLKGDVKFAEVAPKCSFITPVPGGVGPMTRVMLLRNTLTAAKK